MSEISLALHPLEAQALARGATQLRRPLEPQPLPETDSLRDIPGENRWWAAYATENKWGTEYRPLGSDQQHEWKLPLSPGDVLVGLEDYQILSFGGSVAQVKYTADGKNAIVDSNRLPNRLGRRPAKGMPKNIARHRRRVVYVRVERVREISGEDLAACGWPPDNSPPRYGTRLTLRGRRLCYAEHWDTVHPDHPWESSWCWVAELEEA